MNISTTFLNALKHTSSDVEGQRSPEILLGQIYKVSLEDKGFLLPLAGGEFRLLNPFYYYGLMAMAIPGWTAGTFLGAVSGELLSARILNALGVALYGMFIAVIIPPAKSDRVIAALAAISMVLSLAASCLPPLSSLSSGLRIILLTLLIAGAAAFLFPIKEESNHES